MTEATSHGWSDKKKLTDRAKRIEGQAAGVARMISDDRACRDILQQIVALNSAAQELAVLLLGEHVQARCAEGTDGHEVAEELSALLRRTLKL